MPSSSCAALVGPKSLVPEGANKWDYVGSNTGNLAFLHALETILDIETVDIPLGYNLSQQACYHADVVERFERFDRFVTTSLIWIGQGQLPDVQLVNLLDIAGDRPVIPISIGLQCDVYTSDFDLQREFVRLLKKMSEKATLGVRGTFTAETLYKFGIKNLEIVGCPSVYLLPHYFSDYSFLLGPPPERISAMINVRTLHTPLSRPELKMLEFGRCNGAEFVEQTHVFVEQCRRQLAKCGLKDWHREHSHLFWSAVEWIEYSRKFNFCFGSRFHGNVCALLGGCRSLFVPIDVRTRELSGFFGFPTAQMADFDGSKSLEALWYEADYANFTTMFHKNTSAFICFCWRNGLCLSEPFRQSLNGFQFDQLGAVWAADPHAP